PSPPPATSPTSSTLPPPNPKPTGRISRPFGTEIAPLSSMGIPSLEVRNNTTGEKKTYALAKNVINIGRDVTNDIAINDQSVSGLHIQIVRQGDQLILIHPHPNRNETANGLLYHGHKIRGDEPFRK